MGRMPWMEYPDCGSEADRTFALPNLDIKHFEGRNF